LTGKNRVYRWSDGSFRRADRVFGGKNRSQGPIKRAFHGMNRARSRFFSVFAGAERVFDSKKARV
jgi:hypothetical protein